jgi:hypothetical protein
MALQNLKTFSGKDDPAFFAIMVDQFLTDLPRDLQGPQTGSRPATL